MKRTRLVKPKSERICFDITTTSHRTQVFVNLCEITLRFFDVLHRNLNSFVQILVPRWNVTGARAGRSFFATRSVTARARPAGSRFV